MDEELLPYGSAEGKPGPSIRPSYHELEGRIAELEDKVAELEQKIEDLHLRIRFL